MLYIQVAAVDDKIELIELMKNGFINKNGSFNIRRMLRY